MILWGESCSPVSASERDPIENGSEFLSNIKVSFSPTIFCLSPSATDMSLNLSTKRPTSAGFVEERWRSDKVGMAPTSPGARSPSFIKQALRKASRLVSVSSISSILSRYSLSPEFLSRFIAANL